MKASGYEGDKSEINEVEDMVASIPKQIQQFYVEIPT
jgi:hypothetical protein